MDNLFMGLFYWERLITRVPKPISLLPFEWWQARRDRTALICKPFLTIILIIIPSSASPVILWAW